MKEHCQIVQQLTAELFTFKELKLMIAVFTFAKLKSDLRLFAIM